MLGLAVGHLALSTVTRMHAARARLTARTEVLVAQRIARHVLRRELRHGRPGVDWEARGDSIRLRAFRGVALVCGSDSASASIIVSFSGDRAPDPSKDSLLLFDGLGAGEARALRSVASSGAACGGPSARWVLDRPVGRSAIVAKLFEHGSYGVSGGALRYRRGAGGRQPLTPDVWAATSGWSFSTEHLGLRVESREPDAGAAWQGFLAWTRSE